MESVSLFLIRSTNLFTLREKCSPFGKLEPIKSQFERNINIQFYTHLLDRMPDFQ